MNKYEIEIWFRYGQFEKDFEIVEIEADTESEAFLIAKDLRHWVFSVKLLSTNGIALEKDGKS